MVEYYDEKGPPSCIISLVVVLVMSVIFLGTLQIISSVSTLSELEEVILIVILGLILTITLGVCYVRRLQKWISHPRAMDFMRKNGAEGETLDSVMIFIRNKGH